MGFIEKSIFEGICTPTLIIWQVEIIRRFQQDNGETLSAAWERFEDALLKCPEHKLNKYEQLQIFYNGLGIDTKNDYLR